MKYKGMGGQNRSASIVIAYIMKTNSWNLKKSLKYVKDKRSLVNPHTLYISQLIDYEKKLLGTDSDVNPEDYPNKKPHDKN
jgi:protein-tyrosine phosphatase